MKRISHKLPAVLLALLLVVFLMPQRAEAAGASFKGSGTLRAGDTVKVTFSVSGSNILGVDANLTYDSSSLEMTGSSQIIGGSWDMKTSGSKYILWDSEQTSPINGDKSLFSVTFKVKSSVSPGTSVSASITGITVSDGASDTSLGSASWSATIAAPLSGNANLEGLSCSNADLSPSFSSGTTEYSTTVPYSVSKLSLSVRTADSGADYSVSGNDLSVGSNTVTVKVTAANGNTKRYYIYVTRQQDPNYVASTDATLSELSISDGVLSPAFSSEITDYVVYLPYEAEHISLSGVAHDSKALSVTKAEKPLIEGENLVSIRCTAEDGITTLDYTVHVIRMPAYAGVLPEIIPPDAEPEPEPEPPTLWESLSAALWLPVTLPYTDRWLPVWALAAIGFGLLLVLLVILAYFLGRAGGRRKAQRALMAVPEEETPALLTRLAEQLEQEKQPAEGEDSPAPEPVAEEPQEVPAEETPAEEEPVAEVAEESPAEETPAEEVPAEEITVEETAEERPAQEETPAEEIPVEEAAEEISAEEIPAEETKISEAEEVNSDADEKVDGLPKPVEPARPSETLEELGGMSLDDLLKDIRDM